MAMAMRTDSDSGTSESANAAEATATASASAQDTILSEDDENLMQAYDDYWANFQGTVCMCRTGTQYSYVRHSYSTVQYSVQENLWKTSYLLQNADICRLRLPTPYLIF